MVDLFETKVGSQLRYDIPDSEKNEYIRSLNGRVVEVVNIEKVYDVHFNPVLKHIVKDLKTGEERALGGDSNLYLTLLKEGNGTTQLTCQSIT